MNMYLQYANSVWEGVLVIDEIILGFHVMSRHHISKDG